MTQEQAFAILTSGANVFLTGEPGSGKTHTINRYAEYLRTHGVEPAITASTGIAATHINGMTIHSWSGIGISRELGKEDLEQLVGRKRLASRFARTHVLIIDEVSMLDARTLDLIEAVCRTSKRNGMPWGGIQVVFVGDFFQLPPVVAEGEPAREFAYTSSAWQGAAPVVAYLSEQYRQDDERLVALLANIREGRISEATRAALSSRITGENEMTEPHTRLYAHNVNVDRVNNEKLDRLAGEPAEFFMESRGPGVVVGQLKRGCLSPEVLRLKVGAEVMFTKNNFPEGFANGTLGVVESFSDDGAPVVRTARGQMVAVEPMEWAAMDGGRTLARISQLPLRLAWAITVHKSQGLTLDAATIDLSEAFEYGQGYVALSRVRALSGLRLIGYNERALEVHPEVLQCDAQFRAQSAAATETFGAISPADQERRAKAFIAVCGGKAKKAGQATAEARDTSGLHEKENTYEKTLALWKQGQGLADIARLRILSPSTVFAHLEELFMRGKVEAVELRRIAPAKLLAALPEISAAFNETGGVKLAPVFQKFGGTFSYDDLRLARILLNDSRK